MLDIEKQLSRFIASLPLIKVKDVVLEHPANSDFGDYSTNIAMQLFGKLKLEQKAQLQVDSPRDLAQLICSQLQEYLEKKDDLKNSIQQIKVEGPGFINFYLTENFFLKSLQSVVSDSEFGLSTIGKGKTWELEHTSPNPNKSMHLGHLRNNLVGMALGRLWEAIGIKVIYEAVDNNRGIAIAKLMWGYLKFARSSSKLPIDIEYWKNHQEEWQSPEELNERPDRFVDKLYVLASVDFEQNQEVEATVRQMVVDWESNDPLTRDLWERVLEYSHQGQQLTLERLGNRWDKVWHEHEYYEKGKELVDEGIKKGVFQVLEDGAVLTNLEGYNLPDTIVRKADGTALYITQDLALTKLKLEQLNAHKLHWVVGPEQRIALMQVFAVCEQLEICKIEELEHIPYGYMSIKGLGKMSSREGNVVYIDELLDQAKERALGLINSEKFTDKQKEKLAEMIGVGAVKYSVLKVSRTQDMEFDVNAALALEGNSGPYLQYTHARAKSVLHKAGLSQADLQKLLSKAGDNDISTEFLEFFFNNETLDILRLIYQFPAVVEAAALENEPSSLTTYLYNLSQKFNSFYNKHQILVETQTLKNHRLAVVVAVAHIIFTGLNILGIEAPDEM